MLVLHLMLLHTIIMAMLKLMLTQLIDSDIKTLTDNHCLQNETTLLIPSLSSVIAIASYKLHLLHHHTTRSKSVKDANINLPNSLLMYSYIATSGPLFIFLKLKSFHSCMHNYSRWLLHQSLPWFCSPQGCILGCSLLTLWVAPTNYPLIQCACMFVAMQGFSDNYICFELSNLRL